VSDRDKAEPKTSLTSADPPRNFSLSVGERIRALTIGAPAWSTRKKGIEDLEARWVSALVACHDALVLREASAETISKALDDKAATFDLKKINAQLDIHNRYYPIEASLPIDPKTGDYLVSGRRWFPEEPCTVARLIERARAVIRDRSDS
jgi:hypothetical protein